MKITVVRNGKVENFVAVTEETREATIAHFVEQGLVVYEGSEFCEIGWLFDESSQTLSLIHI